MCGKTHQERPITYCLCNLHICESQETYLCLASYAKLRITSSQQKPLVKVDGETKTQSLNVCDIPMSFRIAPLRITGSLSKCTYVHFFSLQARATGLSQSPRNGTTKDEVRRKLSNKKQKQNRQQKTNTHQKAPAMTASVKICTRVH